MYNFYNSHYLEEKQLNIIIPKYSLKEIAK